MTTSVNTQFHVDKSLFDYTLGFEVSVDVHYDPATLSMSNYNAVCGRGNNVNFPSGMFIPGGFAPAIFFGKWKDGTLSTISKTGLTADWYRYKMIVTATTVQIKLLNLRTSVELSGNIAAIGTSTTSEDKKFTFLCFGIDGVTGAYGSVGVNYSNIKISRGTTCILNIPLSEGAGNKVTDICNSSQYQITFIDPALVWAKLSNYHHYNFRYGFTLYTKSASPNLHIPNTSNQTEITVTPPSGYSRVANYQECRKNFNNCESVFILDDVSAGIQTLHGTFNQVQWAGTMPLNVDFLQSGTLNGKPKWVSAAGDLIQWEDFSPFKWCVRSHVDLPGVQCTSSDDVASPDLCTTWVGRGGTDYIYFELTTGSASDLYTADHDHILFAEGTGVAKELTITSLYSEIVDLTHDRGHLYISSDSKKNLMLYKTDKGVDTPEDLKIWKYVK